MMMPNGSLNDSDSSHPRFSPAGPDRPDGVNPVIAGRREDGVRAIDDRWCPLAAGAIIDRPDPIRRPAPLDWPAARSGKTQKLINIERRQKH